MIPRLTYQSLVDLLGDVPVVALLGPRQVGKTTLALALETMEGLGAAPLYLDLESEQDRAKLSDAEAYLSRHADRLIILDEIHRVPELFAHLRGLVDRGRRQGQGPFNNGNGRFIVLGSASIELLRQSSESLAGRIAHLELTGLNVMEVLGDQQGEASTSIRDQLWQRGGFPDAFRARSDAASLRWRRDFIRTYLQRDIPQFGPRIAEETLRRFWTMLAHSQGGLLNAAALSRSLSVDGKTITNYLDLMVDLLLVRRLAPWHSNSGKRLVKSPKTYVRDSGLVHALLGIENLDALQGHPVAGGSWEGFVIENILSVLPEGGEAYFYRTSAGAEIDLLLDLGGKRWAIEIKRSTAPKLSRGFYHALQDIEPEHAFCVYGGSEAYPLNEGVEAISLLGLMQRLSG